MLWVLQVHCISVYYFSEQHYKIDVFWLLKSLNDTDKDKRYFLFVVLHNVNNVKSGANYLGDDNSFAFVE